MSIKNNLRRVEIFSEGEWKEILFKDLKRGDLFRMFDGNVQHEFVGTDSAFIGTKEWIVDSEPYENDDGVLTVNCITKRQDMNDADIICTGDIK
jgi:hypothetical protein